MWVYLRQPVIQTIAEARKIIIQIFFNRMLDLRIIKFYSIRMFGKLSRKFNNNKQIPIPTYRTKYSNQISGEIVLKPAWGKDQPNNYNGEQNCVVLDGGRNWLWNDVGCNLDYLLYVCQHSKCIYFNQIQIYMMMLIVYVLNLKFKVTL